MAISGWNPRGSSIWAASCDKKIEKLFVNNTLMPLARYPDTGWLTIDAAVENSDGSNTTITVKALTQRPRNTANYWTNANVRWRRWSWWFETRRVSGYSATGVLSLDGKSENHIMGDSGCKGWHFYIDNKFEELDYPGEWFYDSAARLVYLYPPNDVDPSSMLVEGAYRRTGVVLSGGAVTDICFRHQTIYGLSLSKTSTVSGCRFEGIGGDFGGAALSGSWDIADSRISGNMFENNLNTGISWYENSGRKGQSFIDHDTLLNTGTFPGYGGTGSWHGVWILVHLSSNVQVQYNYIDKTGYAGILLGSDGNYVQYNIIKRAMWTLNDGGAIYTDCSRSTLRSNIIYDTKGDLSSSGPWYPLGHGIWLEFLGDFGESVVENNTIVGSGCNGIFLPNNFSCTIRDNVLFDNAEAQLCLEGIDTNTYIDPPRMQNLPQNNTFLGNICYATKRRQRSLEFQSQFDYGSMQGNYFCNPYTDSVVSGYGVGNKRYTLYNYTLSQWRASFPWADPSAKSSPVKRPAGLAENRPYAEGVIFVNESPAARTFSLGSISYSDLDGANVSGSVSVAPFYSKILVYADSALGTKKTSVTEEVFSFIVGRNSLRYYLSEKARVALTLYNQAGREVFRHSETTQGPGAHVIHCNGAAMDKLQRAPGVFAFRFTAVSEGSALVRTGKILLTH